jgi:hypothetical protein
MRPESFRQERVTCGELGLTRSDEKIFASGQF